MSFVVLRKLSKSRSLFTFYKEVSKLLLVFLVVLSSCNCKNKNPMMDVELQRWDAMLNDNSDAAPLVLDSIGSLLLSKVNVLNEEQYAFAQLLVAKAKNKAYIPTISVDSMTNVVSYYAKFLPNSQRLAESYYLLGCAYRDSHEALKAMDNYSKAVCVLNRLRPLNLRLLGRVYMQMSELYGSMNLPSLKLRYIDLATKSLMQIGDSVAALNYYVCKNSAYLDKKMWDSAIAVNNYVGNEFLKLGMPLQANVSFGNSFFPYIQKEEYQKAEMAMQKYENSSMFIGNNVRAGAEIYYYHKGLYYLAIGQNDSAYYYFLKERRVGHDLNNQLASSLGLAKLYRILGQGDSVGKYALEAYELNDSLYNENVARAILQMKNLYDYSENERISKTKSLEAERSKSCLLAFLLVFIVSLFLLCVVARSFYIKEKKKKKLVQKLYFEAVEKIEKLENSFSMLKVIDENKVKEVQNSLKNEIHKLQLEIDAYKSSLNITKDNLLEQEMQNSKVCLRFKYLAFHIVCEHPTAKDWEELDLLMSTKLPGFHNLLLFEKALTKIEYRLCFLVRLNFKAAEIADLLDISRTSVTKIRCRLLKKIFDLEGSLKKFDELIRKIQK